MEIIYDTNLLTIKKIVKEKAKFQKVMLLYDNTISNSTISNIYEIIKEDCIFNKRLIHKDVLQEIYNGYKLLIFCCSADAFVKFPLDRSEFINIYYPKDNSILPYFFDCYNNKTSRQDYLIIKPGVVDIVGLASIYFNRIYKYLIDLLFDGVSALEFDFHDGAITQKTIINEIVALQDDYKFVDLEILKNTDICYADLLVVDYALLVGLNLLIDAVKSNTLQMVDVYKVAKDNDVLIKKYYSMVYDQVFLDLISLNSHFLQNAISVTAKHIYDLIDTKLYPQKSYIDDILLNLKSYCKNCDNICSYLYLFNVFSA